MRKEANGFSLLEALIAMAVVAVLAGIAIPSWQSARATVHAGKARTEMLETIMAAVRHSALAGTEVVLCRPVNDSVEQCATTTNWTEGWALFADLNGNRRRDANEPIIHRQAALTGGVKLWTTGGRTRLVFQPNGGNAGSNVTFTLCDDRGPGKAVTFVLANHGRMRWGRPTSAAAQQCVYGA
ncbi:prepilin-type N-terminal cleavage/methylation domain-containing protein [Lysobacter ruishenii]|uniref:Type II secretion system protein H n=2 Tax=Aerolutibacter ruishenii TaxID=686800 RepID=A0A562LT08_9GAMM|nr:prepilin-type N-terminal cleavage/methylation domain-containing protein [Lysobacter ruishenii]